MNPDRIGADRSPINVWLIEDNDRLRRDLAALLDAEDGTTCGLAVSNCESAIEGLREGAPPDIVFMDIGLPGMDGIEGTRRIRSLSPATRVIVLTIHEEDDSVFQAICAGASGYLLKPAEPGEILDAVANVQRGAAPINGFIARKMLGLFSRLAPETRTTSPIHLTGREKQILQLLVDGLTMKGISAELDVSYHTIDTHLRNIYSKLHVRSRSKAVARALQEKLI